MELDKQIRAWRQKEAVAKASSFRLAAPITTGQVQQQIAPRSVRGDKFEAVVFAGQRTAA
jgi:hypothetical protein